MGGVDQDKFSVHMLRVILFYSIGVLLFCVRKIIGFYRMCDRINRLVEKTAVACIDKKGIIYFVYICFLIFMQSHVLFSN